MTGSHSVGSSSEHASHAHASDGHAHADQGHAEHGSIAKITWAVFAALCVLTCASLLTYTPWWQSNVPMKIGRAVMLSVSIIKAFLVVTFFMHLFWESKWKYVVTFPAMSVSILLVFALVPDIGMRTREYDAARLLNAPEPMPFSVGKELRVEQPAAGAKSDSHGEASAQH